MNKMNKFLMAGLLCSVMACSNSYAQKPVYAQDDAVRVGSRVTYDYYADSLFHVNTKMGFVTDIELKPGETITYIAGGDTTRWLIDKAMVANVQHVYIKPVEKDIKTNVIVNTNLHSYRLEVSSGENYDPLITFRFPEKESSYNNITSRYSSSSSLAKKNFDYRIKAKKNADVSLMPVEIFDDGNKTYIRMPDDNKYDLPVIYNIDPWDGKTLSMVNYRRQGDYFVVDRVMEHGRLFYHQKFYVDFYNEAIQKTKTKEYRQRDTLGGRFREAVSEVGEEIQDDVNKITGKSERLRGIRVYDVGDDRDARPIERKRMSSEQEEQQRQFAEERELQQRRLVEQQRREQALLLKQQQDEAVRQQRLREQQMEARRIAVEKEQARQLELRKVEEKRQLEARKKYEEQMRLKIEAEQRRQEELRLQEAKRIEAEQKARIAVEKERARQEALRQAELKRQEEARRIALQKQREEEARRREAIRLEKEKRNAEIARLTELENKKLDELRKLQEAKKRQVTEGQAVIQRLATGNRQQSSGQQQQQQRRQPAQQQQLQQPRQQQRQTNPVSRTEDARSRELEKLFASVEKSK